MESTRPRRGAEPMVPVLVGGVGYRHLRDHSLGVVLSDELEAEAWPGHVRVEDLSFNPVALAQRLEEELARGAQRLVLVSAVPRGRSPGSWCAYRWDRVLPGPERVQDAVAEAVTGVIALDNTLMVCRQFGGLPEEVAVVEVEPFEESWGDVLSPVVEAAREPMRGAVRHLALDPAAWSRLPVEPLGGGALPRVGLP